MASVRRRLVSEPSPVFSISCSNGPVMPAPAGRRCDPDRPWGHNLRAALVRWRPRGAEGSGSQPYGDRRASQDKHITAHTHTDTRSHTRGVCVWGDEDRAWQTEKEWERDLSFSRLPDKKGIQTSRSHCTRSIGALTKCLIVTELSVLSITLSHTGPYYVMPVNTCMNMWQQFLLGWFRGFCTYLNWIWCVTRIITLEIKDHVLGIIQFPELH